MTKAEHAHSALSEGIMCGILRPGQRIIAAEMACELDMSVIPVREAFRKLEQEGLVDIVPHVGARVRSLPVEELEELLLIRGELEALATRMAVPKLSDATVHELRKYVKEMDTCANKDNAEQYGVLNRRFHIALYEASGSIELLRLINGLWDRIPRAKSIFMLVPHYMQESQTEHRQLLDCLANRDVEQAESLVRQQKTAARKALAVASTLRYSTEERESH